MSLSFEKCKTIKNIIIIKADNEENHALLYNIYFTIKYIIIFHHIKSISIIYHNIKCNKKF